MAHQELLEGQTLRGGGRLVDYSNLVKLPHTVFALPFAIVGATLASYVAPISLESIVWILLAFTSARFAAMGFNRVVDRSIDARNPRTRNREIPAGKLTVREAVISILAASALFLVSAGMLNRICLVLAPFALGWVFLYSYTKRFTRWSHLVLGFALAIAPAGAYMAVAGGWSDPPTALLALAGAVICWVAGFDVLYSLQDEGFDRAQGLHSLPVALGAKGAIRLSRVLHVLCVLLFAASGLLFVGATGIYLAGVVMIAAMLTYEQSLVRVDDLSRIDAAFFNINGVISLVFCTAVIVERFLA
ncbi:MAG: putative 4-hydroxybenzoate polyprenyltransferase [Gemmatimonadota bacterium]|jgi:4-hydroxybenzoate polyprenyltransferase|nr:putative 4-hydroxybenzoate polyprenyltransferase [Gemmatimonadota bacterium]